VDEQHGRPVAARPGVGRRQVMQRHVEGIPVTMDFKDAGHYRVTGGWLLVA
jgi:hypothetical protein